MAAGVTLALTPVSVCECVCCITHAGGTYHFAFGWQLHGK